MLVGVVVVATKSETLKALTAAAIALPGIYSNTEAKDFSIKPSINLQYGHYEENGNRISVDVYQGNGILPVSTELQLKAGWVVDSFAGATPVLTLPESVAHTTSGASGINNIDDSEKVTDDQQAVQVMSGASIREMRYGVDLGFDYSINDLTLHAFGVRSEEPDYLSYAYQVGADWEINKKLTTLSLNFGQNFDEVEPVTRPINEKKGDHNLQLAINHILSKETILRLGLGYVYSHGYLSNPYKKVFVQGLGNNSELQSGGFDKVFYENRPSNRDQWAVSLGFIQYISKLDSSLHLDYRYFIDSWDISSHTLEASYYQPIEKGWMLQPRVRYYTQTDAYFYQDYYAAPRADGYYSSDFRLAGFGSLSGGVNLSREWTNIGDLTESVKLDIGFDYTSHAADLKLGGQTATNVTDFSYFLFTGVLRIMF